MILSFGLGSLWSLILVILSTNQYYFCGYERHKSGHTELTHSHM